MKTASQILIIVLMSVASTASAQDFRRTMENLRDKYQNAENIRIKMSIDVFDTKGNQRSFYRDKIIITKQGSNYHHELSGADMVMNDRYMIMVDKSSRRIIMTKRDVKGETKFYKKAAFSMDSVLQFYENGKFEGTSNDLNKFSATQKEGPIGKIEMFISKAGELKQINYSYRSGQWATIIFEEFNLSPNIEVGEFDEQQFVQKVGKEWHPAAAFAGYEVMRADDAKAFAKN